MIPKPSRAGSFLSLSPTAFHRVAYTDWGTQIGRKATVCVHGLTRTGRDFDVLADALSQGGRVVCPDMPGRGASDWLSIGAEYAFPTYLSAGAAMMSHIGAERVDWIGTSMGGMIGMLLASAEGTPIRRLIINDVGPFLPLAALKRIGNYVGGGGPFADMDAVDAYLRDVHAPFGPLTDEQWRHLAETSSVKEADGGYRLHYDPAIADAFRASAQADIDLWAFWDKVECPVLVLKGENSDLLSEETADQMTQRGPKATLAVIPDCGHAPALMDSAQIAVITDWLRDTGNP